MRVVRDHHEGGRRGRFLHLWLLRSRDPATSPAAFPSTSCDHFRFQSARPCLCCRLLHPKRSKLPHECLDLCHLRRHPHAQLYLRLLHGPTLGLGLDRYSDMPSAQTLVANIVNRISRHANEGWYNVAFETGGLEMNGVNKDPASYEAVQMRVTILRCDSGCSSR